MNLSLLKNGKEYIQEVIKTIELAEENIFLHTYILEVDEITGPVIQALNQKAKLGVQVFVICDGVGSMSMSESNRNVLIESEFNFSFYNSPLQFNHIGRRLHQKVLLVDQKHAIIGGINLAKRFNLPDNNNPWLDYACAISDQNLNNIYQDIYPIYKRIFREEKDYLNSILKKQLIEDQTEFKIITNDWMRYKNEIYHSYLGGIIRAKKSITLMATYFIPGKRLLRELRRAKSRGVEINLIFCPVSDHPTVNKVEQYFYGWYLQNEFNIYEWSESTMHGKIALIDDKWTSIGSYNHNYISRYGNLEMNLEIISPNFVKQIQEEFQNTIKSCKRVDQEMYQKRFGFYDRFFNFCTYLLTNFITVTSLLFIFKRSKAFEEN